MNNSLYITRTAVVTAIIIAVQFLGASAGPLATGPVVNMVLIVTVMLFGIRSGLTAALISPVCAKIAGIGPFWALIPFVAAGNAALVLCWHYIGNLDFGKKIYSRVTAAAAAAVVKFAVLYAGAVKFAVPFILKLPPEPAAAVSAMFSVQQIFTAGVGGAAAVVMLPLLEGALKTGGGRKGKDL